MKVQMKAIVTYTWEDDTENWKEDEFPPQTKQQLVECIKNYTGQDASYIFDMEPKSIEIQAAE